MDINTFLKAMESVDANALMDVANQVTSKVALSAIDALLPHASYGWLWIG